MILLLKRTIEIANKRRNDLRPVIVEAMKEGPGRTAV